MALIPDTVGRNCRDGYRAVHDSGSRPGTQIRYIVLHSAENEDDPSSLSSAANVASWFEQDRSGGSANAVVDWARCYLCLPDLVVPWGAPPINRNGWHLEHCGRSSWTRTRWLLPWNRLMLRRGAYRVAVRCHRYKIPARYLTVAELKRDFGDADGNGGKHLGGIVTHNTVTLAYHQSDHTDPGPGFPLDVYLGYVQGYLKGMGK